MVEDVPTDAEIAEHILRTDGLNFISTRVDTKEAFLKTLESFHPDLIISDYSMPQFDGMTALNLTLELHPDLPFIILTASNNEETAIECMKAGAWNYVLKNHIIQLPFAVKAALIRSEALRAKVAAEESLRRSNRALTVLSQANQLLVRSENESELLPGICDVVIRYGGYRMAWIGFCEDDSDYWVKPAATAGFVDGYLDAIKISWADNMYGQGPTGKAIRFGKPVFTSNIASDPNYKPFRKEALKRGYASSIALPLLTDGNVFGTLNIYAATPDAFDDNEITLLTELAGDLAYGIGAIRAETGRKKSEEALNASEQKYREVVEGISDAIFTVDLNGYFTFTNYTTQILTGYSHDELTKLTYLDLVEAPHHIRVKRHYLNQFLRKIDQTYIEFPLITKTGKHLWIGQSAALSKRAGEIVGFHLISRDITERKKAEEALRESEYLLRETQIIAGLGSYVLDFAAGLWNSSELLDKIFGIDKTYNRTVEGWANLIHPDDRTRMIDYFSNDIIGSHQNFNQEYRVVRPNDNTERWVHGLGKLEFDSRGILMKMYGTIQDVTDRKYAETKLIEESSFRNSVISNTAEGIAVCHEIIDYPHVGFTVWNSRMEEITGYTMEEINRLGWYQSMYPDPDYQRAAIERMDRMRIGDNLVAEDWEITRKGGQKRTLSLSTSVLTTTDNIVHVLGLMVDVTDRKRAEAEKEILEHQIHHLQKEESLGRMAGAVAHRFNNLLQGIMGNVELALEKIPRGEAFDYLMEAIESSRKASEISGQMLTYVGQTTGISEPIGLSTICRRYLPLMEAIIPKNVRLVTNLPSPGPTIISNAHNIQQILANMITNASEAIGSEEGAIRLTVNTVSAGEISKLHRFPINWKPLNDSYACLEVSDAGSGISNEDIDKLFDPFYSTKFTGRGLGLTVVFGILRANKGVLTVESEVGRGSIFRIYFPLTADKFQNVPIEKAKVPEIKGSGTLLIVEDDDHIRDLAKSMLTYIGYKVLVARDGVEAVDVFQQHRDEIQCVISDLTMPRMNGWETLVALRKLAPGIPVIIASGYDEAHVMTGERTEKPQGILTKPYNLQRLREAIEHAVVDNE